MNPELMVSPGPQPPDATESPAPTPDPPTRPTGAGPRVPAQSADDVVVVASADGPRDLVALLDRLDAGRLVPGHLIIVTGQDADDLGPALAAHRLPKRLASVRVARLAGPISPQRALTESLTHLSDDAIRYAWLLTGAARPSPRTLAVLHETASTSRAAAVVAPKVRTRETPARLLSVGFPVTTAGRWVPRPRPGESDQGQYDDRSDVLATSAVGALIDLRALREVGGHAPRLTRATDAVAADVDLGWRMHRHGHRVLLDPRGIVEIDPEHTAAAGLGELSASARRHLRSIALGAAPLAGWPLRILGVLGTALAAMVLMLLAKRPAGALRELIDGLSVLRLGRAASARRRFATRQRISRRGLSQLFVPRETARSALVDDVLPTLRNRSPQTQQDQQLRGRRPQAVAHPAFLGVLAALGLVIAQGRDIGGSLFGRIGWGVTGGEVLGSAATGAALWRSAADAWGGPGLGSETIWSPALGLLAAATAVVEHLPFVDSPAAPAAAAMAAILFLTLPVAALTMYAALAVITPRRSLRALGAVAWIATGLASDTISQGRIGGAVVLIVLPLAAAALVRALGPRGRSYDAAQAGLALALLGAFAPVVTGFAVAVTLVLGLVPSWSFRRALGAAVVPAIVLLPFIRDLVGEPQSALGGVGLFDWSGTIPSAWRLALLNASSPAADAAPPWLLPLIPFLAVPFLVLALLGVLRGRRRTASLTAVVVAGVALAAAVVLSRLVVDTVPVGTAGAGAAIRPWAGTLLMVYALIVVALAVRGLDVIARIGLRRRLARPMATASGLVAAGVLLVGTGWAGFGSTLSTFTDTRPAVAVDHANGPLAGRTLLIDRLTADEGAEAATAYRLVSADAGLPVRTLPEPPEVSEALDDIISGIDVGAPDVGPGESGAAEVLAQHAVGFITLTEALPAEVERTLDATDGLRRLPDRPGQRWWRVDSTTSDVPSPGRVVLRSSDGDGVVIPTRHRAQTTASLDGPGTLEVAETESWVRASSVRLDGAELSPQSSSMPTYVVPEAGRLTIDVVSADRPWRLAAALAFPVIAYAALPFGGPSRRREVQR